ncbi:heat shock protein beta-11-like isoform X1 [Erpetoichthys calabaricus]|uniref:heat shock protein beta-11-like isoform X1 n=1 Tax=Erpetoichthys calabaricus TaxID=27687 RepID=UPI00223473BC|nr:heat shock protein beta-11-like isoform X1 [Erpetoichthys calabaricus]
MWSSSLFQPSFSTPMAVRVPVSALWPQSELLCIQMENEMARQMDNMRRSADLMNQLQYVLRRETLDAETVPRSAAGKAPSCKVEKDGQHFSATLEVEDFTPEELTDKQVGRKVLLSGKKEKKEESEGGSYSYRYQEFRRELELPEDVNPEELSCSVNNGQLRIEAPRMALPSVPERVVPIKSDNSGFVKSGEEPKKECGMERE